MLHRHIPSIQNYISGQQAFSNHAAVDLHRVQRYHHRSQKRQRSGRHCRSRPFPSNQSDHCLGRRSLHWCLMIGLQYSGAGFDSKNFLYELVLNLLFPPKHINKYQLDKFREVTYKHIANIGNSCIFSTFCRSRRDVGSPLEIKLWPLNRKLLRMLCRCSAWRSMFRRRRCKACYLWLYRPWAFLIFLHFDWRMNI